MGTDKKRLLSAQLEQQAQALTQKEDNEELVITLLSTCSAFLRAAESFMPERFSYITFQNIYAGYLGNVAEIKIFFEKNKSFLDPNDSQYLKKLQDSLEQIGKEQKELNAQMQAAQKRKNAAVVALQNSKTKLEKEKASCEALAQEKQKEEAELVRLQKKAEGSRRDTETLQTKINNAKAESEELVKSFQAAQDAYAEIKAYYSELDRIKEGMQKEGIVSVESFSEKVRDMDRKGNALIHDYDKILKNLNADLSDLKQKIENRRLAGN